MPSSCMSKIKTLFVFCLAFCLACFILTMVFQKNLLMVIPDPFFIGFQADSEALVVGGVLAKKYRMQRTHNLGFLVKDGKEVVDSRDAIRITNQPGLSFNEYRSSYGIQAIFYSKVAKLAGLGSLPRLQYFSSAILSVIIILLFVLYRRIYDSRFAIMFLIGIVSSPWLVSFAKNLYWSPFLWFLPTLFAAFLYLSKSKVNRIFMLSGVAISTLIKSLAGYEYITSITLMACSIFLVAPFFKKNSENQSPDFKMAGLVFFACVMGFVLALLIHANIRGDSIINGLKAIYEADVKRRTYGDPSSFDPIYSASLSASPVDVIKTYFYVWGTIPFVAWLPGESLKYLLAISLIGITVKFQTGHPTFKRDLMLIVVFIAVPISWFVLGKAHSYIHTHTNYVLWYFGFASALLYVAMNSILVILIESAKWLKQLDPRSL